MGLLTTVYFPGPSGYNELPYRKAMVYNEDVGYFLDMGAVLEQPTDLFEAETVPDPGGDEEGYEAEEWVDGDKGDGVPGSLQWHNTQINDMKVKKKIIDYVSEVIGRDANEEMDKNKTLTVIRLRAKKLIKEFLDNDS